MSAPAVLVTGGAGFVGSHAAKSLARAGYLPVSYDDLSNGSRDAVRWGPLEQGSLEEAARLAEVLDRYRPIAVLHFAAFIEVADSMRDPVRFYRNNVGGSLALLHAMLAAGIEALIFSSTAAVYGEPHTTPIPESHPLAPINPYGVGKMLVERIIADAHAAGGPTFCALRYFNAAGADPDGELRENHRPETHLIPLAIDAALGKLPEISVFGEDYPTEDGTCIRDYSHVSDLADAHVLALERILEGGEPLVANLGTGAGSSVREVLSTVGTVTGRPVPVRTGPRRAGDPATLVADPSRAMRELGWRPTRSDLTTIVQDACRSRR